jgi:hypothetical protein
MIYCPSCDSICIVDYSGSSEYHGWCYQTVTVECADADDKKCDFTVSVTADSSKLDDIDAKLSAFINSLVTGPAVRATQ